MEALATIEYADSYFKTKPNSSVWSSLSEDDKTAWLCEATRRIYAIPGFKFTPELIEMLTAIPDDLMQACCEVVLNLVTTGSEDNPHLINQKLGIKSISFGKDSASYDDTIKTSALGLDNSVFSEYAQSILNKYILKAFPYV